MLVEMKHTDNFARLWLRNFDSTRGTIAERPFSEPSMSDRSELLKAIGDKRLTVRCS
jgi:hypothetical protein